MENPIHTNPVFYALGVGIAFFFGGCALENDHDTILERLQGDWEVEKVEIGGELIPLDKVHNKHFILKGSQLIATMSPKDPAEVHLAPDANPAWIDLTDRDKMVMLGIYRFDGHSWEICIGDVGDPRPTEFKTTAGTRTCIMVLRRKAK
ncbi:MAG: TIGR03067 domain-containing protein [Phycisphaerales bacterium]|nr:MAG: TIGR03067 domain-containing protein [Phycisphaerales bacterium]